MEENDKLFVLTDLNPRPEPWYLLNMSLGGEGDGLDVSGSYKSLNPTDN